MIGWLSGQLQAKTATGCILRVGGVGYDIALPKNVRETLGAVGSPLELWVHLQVSADAHKLFGFISLQEKALFELLLTVSGVGPKIALAIIGVAPVADIQQAIAVGDQSMLKKVSGVGAKTAARVILELQQKVGLDAPASATPHAHADLVDALIALGYTETESRTLAAKVPADLATASEKLKWVLQHRS